jgi:regulatory protein
VKPPSKLSLKARAVRLLAQREHSRAELVRKLQADAQTPEALEAMLDDLTQRGLLSDHRSAEQIVHAREKRFGARRVAQDLKQKGIPEAVAKPLLQNLKENEFATAQSVWSKRFAEPPASAKARAQQTRFLMGRGFSAEVIRKILGGAEEE